MHPSRVVIAGLAGIALPVLALAAAPPIKKSTAQPKLDQAFFDTRVAPILKDACLDCHGGSTVMSHTDLRSEAALKASGSKGRVLAVSIGGKSRIHNLVSGRQAPLMPPGGKLSDSKVSDLTRWLDAGAPYFGRTLGHAKQQVWWAFAPIKMSIAKPSAKNSLSAIDTFVQAGLQRNGLTWNPPASRRDLIRRAYFDLTGLPPTFEEVQAFEKDRSPNAWSKVVDRLLASPQYGERWGRHWLDIVRYADSGGFEGDKDRPNAWRYRDWVINAFNQDTPYNTFLEHQLAGDELAPGDPAALVATGYLAAGPKDIVENNARTRANEVDDLVATTGSAFLGLTIACARCHDHKYDQLPQADYYRLAAIFAPTERRDMDLCTPDERKAIEARIAQSEAKLKPLRDEYGALRGKGEAAARKMGSLQPAEAEIEAGLGTEMQRYRDVRKDIDMVEVSREQVPVAMAVTDPGPTFGEYRIHRRGDAYLPGDPIKPGFLKCLPGNVDIPDAPAGAKTTGRRTALAKWITSPENPLTTRVWMNRVWRHHFGRGIVATPSDFGVNGELPTHPELLDYLSAKFAAGGMKLKPIHREILLSKTWMQSSAIRPSAAKIDPLNKLLWRMPLRRLEAEAVRDSILKVAGGLDLKMGGPPIYPPVDPSLRSDTFQGMNWPITEDDMSTWRRSVYVKVKRSLLLPQLEVFDCPEITASVATRNSTTTPLQALTLMNDPLVLQQANVMTSTLYDSFGFVADTTPVKDRALVEVVYQRALQRNPTPREAKLAYKILTTQGRSRLCLLMFNLNEFVYVP
jgi:cytochrome c553